MKSRGKDQYFSRAVAKALETLEVLQAADGPLALNEVAQRLQLSKTSTFRLLRTLETSGCLRASEWGKYSLAPGVNSLVSTQTVARLLRAGIPLMQQLSRQLRETTSLAALFDTRAFVVESLRARGADSRRRSRHQRDLALEPAGHDEEVPFAASMYCGRSPPPCTRICAPLT